jgi:hypothetical protein
MRKLSRGVAVAAAVQAVAFACVAVVALDLYAHRRVEAVAGLNIWGYRGAVAHQKQPREIRLAVVGGARAFGLGSSSSWTIATVVRQQVMLTTDRPGQPLRQVVPLTLAWPGALPDSYVATLEHFAYLAPDYICFYDDLGVGGSTLPAERSGLYARTGYWPALPVVLQEKGMLWRFGSVRAGYAGGASSTSGIVRQVAGTSVQFIGRAVSRVDRVLARSPVPHRADDPERYATELMQAIDVALSQAKGVVVALSPIESPLQSANAAAVMPRLKARASTAKSLRVVDLSDEPLLLDVSQRLDDWNYGGDAIAAAAIRIAPAVLDLIRDN